jgi:hypothetical protein
MFAKVKLHNQNSKSILQVCTFVTYHNYFLFLRKYKERWNRQTCPWTFVKRSTSSLNFWNDQFSPWTFQIRISYILRLVSRSRRHTYSTWQSSVMASDFGRKANRTPVPRRPKPLCRRRHIEQGDLARRPPGRPVGVAHSRRTLAPPTCDVHLLPHLSRRPPAAPCCRPTCAVHHQRARWARGPGERTRRTAAACGR